MAKVTAITSKMTILTSKATIVMAKVICVTLKMTLYPEFYYRQHGTQIHYIPSLISICYIKHYDGHF